MTKRPSKHRDDEGARNSASAVGGRRVRGKRRGTTPDDAFSVHFLLHVTLVNGQPVVVFERFRLESLG
jgi:hypothetical protein